MNEQYKKIFTILIIGWIGFIISYFLLIFDEKWFHMGLLLSISIMILVLFYMNCKSKISFLWNTAWLLVFIAIGIYRLYQDVSSICPLMVLTPVVLMKQFCTAFDHINNKQKS